MPSKIRRVVTGHDALGHSKVIDDRVLPEAARVGIWFTGPGASKNDDDRALEFHPTKLEPPPVAPRCASTRQCPTRAATR